VIGGTRRSTMLRGVAARVLRGRVEAAVRETGEMYLGWIRDSLALSR
jgi:hypothetical protein